MDFMNFKPGFLIAMPELVDPNFNKSVVLLTDYDPQSGASGFVINRKTEMALQETLVLSEGELNANYNGLPLWFGGPVEEEKVWVMYDGTSYKTDENPCLGDDICIAKDIHILTDREAHVDPKRVRVFHGYAGWSGLQLEEEIAGNAWLTCPLSKDLLFDTEPENIWDKSIKNLGIDPSQLSGGAQEFKN